MEPYSSTVYTCNRRLALSGCAIVALLTYSGMSVRGIQYVLQAAAAAADECRGCVWGEGGGYIHYV